MTLLRLHPSEISKYYQKLIQQSTVKVNDMWNPSHFLTKLLFVVLEIVSHHLFFWSLQTHSRALSRIFFFERAFGLPIQGKGWKMSRSVTEMNFFFILRSVHLNLNSFESLHFLFCCCSFGRIPFPPANFRQLHLIDSRISIQCHSIRASFQKLSQSITLVLHPTKLQRPIFIHLLHLTLSSLIDVRLANELIF